jgi:hypothetical protein
MSKRRTSGEIVYKQPNAGFVGTPGLCQIQPEADPDFCMMNCDDPDCREWATLWACDENGVPTGGVACHVSECQMLDAKKVAANP